MGELEKRVREIWARKVAEDPELADFVTQINRMAEDAAARKGDSKGRRVRAPRGAAPGGEDG
jgi:hypothetical protein